MENETTYESIEMQRQKKMDDMRKTLTQEWEQMCAAGKQKECFIKMLSTWLDFKKRGCRSYEGEEVYESFLKAHMCEELTDAEYVQTITAAKNYIKFYMVTDILWVTRNLLKRCLCITKEEVEACTMEKDEKFPNTYLTGVLMLSETVVLTGARENVGITEEEMQLLKLAKPEAIPKCIESGILQKEMTQDYLEYVMAAGVNELVPLLVNYKFKEEKDGCIQ